MAINQYNNCLSSYYTTAMFFRKSGEKCLRKLYFLYRLRMAFSTHNMATPLSANTAAHMEA